MGGPPVDCIVCGEPLFGSLNVPGPGRVMDIDQAAELRQHGQSAWFECLRCHGSNYVAQGRREDGLSVLVPAYGSTRSPL